MVSSIMQWPSVLIEQVRLQYGKLHHFLGKETHTENLYQESVLDPRSINYYQVPSLDRLTKVH